ncbi:MAG: carbohydrate-binding protein, partial [Cytophagaceae bacterium]
MKNIFKNFFITLLLIVGTSITWAQTATINLNQTRQDIKGFGGMNHPVWIGDLTPDQRNTAFGNGPGQIGMSILRIWISDNPTQWQREIETARRAIALGAIVFASPWNPPSSMTEVVDGRKRLRYDRYNAYATHLNDFNTFMKNNGVDLYAISIQNEPDYAHDWTDWTPQEILRFMKENAGSIQTRVIAPESFQYRKNISDPILNDPAALANLDILGAHLYGTQLRDFPYPLFKEKGMGKELWMTEVYTDSRNDADLWPMALDVAYNIHNSMVEAEFSTYVWWYIRRYYSPIKENGQISKRGYCMAQYSKFIRPGYVRIDATKNPVSDVYVSAYKKGNDVAIVAVNRGSSSRTITLSIPGTRVTTWEKYVTSGSKSLLKEANVNAPNGTFQITLDAQSVTTFNGVGANTAVQSPYGGTPASIPGIIQAERYDLGGQGVAYNDLTPGNSGNVFRNDDVDIEVCSDQGGGYNVGWIAAGEWLEYTVNVATARNYNLTARVASTNAGGSFRVLMDGVDISGPITVPNTGGWQDWESVTIENIALTAGEKVMRITMDGSWFNINYVEFATPCTPTTIIPYVQINGGAWSQTSSATLVVGNSVRFGPQPVTGGSWSWSGPNNYSATSREITLSNIQTNQAGNYVATYTNAGG